MSQQWSCLHANLIVTNHRRLGPSYCLILQEFRKSEFNMPEATLSPDDESYLCEEDKVNVSFSCQTFVWLWCWDHFQIFSAFVLKGAWKLISFCHNAFISLEGCVIDIDHGHLSFCPQKLIFCAEAAVLLSPLRTLERVGVHCKTLHSCLSGAQSVLTSLYEFFISSQKMDINRVSFHIHVVQHTHWCAE